MLLNRIAEKEPFLKEFFGLRRDVEDLFNGYLNDYTRNRTDIYEEDGIVYLEMEVPGMSKKDITLQLDNGELIVQASLKEGDTASEETKPTRKYVMKEREKVIELHKRFSIPKDIDIEAIQATVENGLLKMSFCRKEKPKAKVLELL